MTPDDDKLSAVDHDALGRAVALVRASEDPGRRDQIARMLAEDDWFEAATFAAYSCQRRALGLRPWQDPPCYGDSSNDGRNAEAAALLQRLLDAGLSRWEADPAGALAALVEPDRLTIETADQDLDAKF
jgi:hypothetical protein